MIEENAPLTLTVCICMCVYEDQSSEKGLIVHFFNKVVLNFGVGSQMYKQHVTESLQSLL